ncbi:P-loop containing nucleoside triphosphate hydrolase protein [Cristinia sonorae]|uniref:P-loop containing nucleoside triphosphate hydrolase protein n=1 Tax=Cristinia sonorae TaxID=1940300 RepID=A0A8K0UH98_9AGAR|nr:P-loop containing nucleoside triphosphate hydrolase protein [Cristinia sonorae]
MLSPTQHGAPLTSISPGNTGVGLSDPVLSSGRRKMLDLVNRLHSTGVQLDIDLPMIAVIGSQSAGKSSLIESISGVTLPRASGTCTRCPTECRLSWSPESWKCLVSLRFITDARGQPLGQIRNEPFGEAIFDKDLVEERIRRAQRAILNPNTASREFLNGPDEDPTDRDLTFSMNCVSLQISGPDVADLSFCDLPGLIVSVGKGGSDGDIELVKSLVTAYISRPSCIILLTVACETDLENQGAHHLAKVYDPEGKRTIGVLTKPDRIPIGEEENWIRFIKNDYEALENGWYSVKQPDSRALKAGISWSDAREKEREFFTLTSPWSELDFVYQRQLGTGNLTERLSDVLSELIAKRLPDFQDELQKLLQGTEETLRKLPKPPSPDALGEVLHIVSEFSRDLSKHLEGTPSEQGLLQAIRPALETFKVAIRSTAPRFIPRTGSWTPTASPTSDITPDFLSNEEGTKQMHTGPQIYLQDVMDKANSAITRELPDHYPFIICKEYILSLVSQWEVPARNLFDAIERVLLSHVKVIINEHFGKFAHGGLQQHAQTVVNDFIKTRSNETMARVLWLLALEKNPRTLNGHYYSDYRDKFLAHYRALRQSDDHGSFLKNLKTVNSKKPSSNSFGENARSALSYLADIGLEGLKAADLAKLLPPDPYEPALNIMASVRAYFQVAYKRFADNVPNAIDYELVLSLDRDRALYNALLKGLGITGSEGFQRCKDFLQEPPTLVARREELQKKVERLQTAKKELLDVFL